MQFWHCIYNGSTRQSEAALQTPAVLELAVRLFCISCTPNTLTQSSKASAKSSATQQGQCGRANVAGIPQAKML